MQLSPPPLPFPPPSGPPISLTVAVISPTVGSIYVVDALPIVGELPAVAMEMPRWFRSFLIIFGDEDGSEHAAPFEAGAAVEVRESCICARGGGADTGREVEIDKDSDIIGGSRGSASFGAASG